jgi:Rnf-Nqr subunit, membrane protein
MIGDLTWILISSVVNNFTLTLFLGLCSFFGVTNKQETARRLGMANIFVLVLTAFAAWFLNRFVLEAAPCLRLISFIIVIASLEPDAVPRAGYLPAAHHHQLRHPGVGHLPDQPRLRAAPGTGLRPRFGESRRSMGGEWGREKMAAATFDAVI